MTEPDVSATRREGSGGLLPLRHRAFDILGSEYLVLVLTILYFLVLWPIVPAIAAPATLLDIIASMGPLLVVAIGQTFVLIVAGIDLSAPSVLAISAVVAASMMTADDGYLANTPFAVPGGLLSFLVIGGAIGWLNGAAVTALKMPPFIVTLSTMMFFSGAAIWYTAAHTDATSIGDLPPAFIAIGQTESGGGVIALAIAAVVTVRRSFGAQSDGVRTMALRHRRQSRGRRNLRRAGAARRHLGFRDLRPLHCDRVHFVHRPSRDRQPGARPANPARHHRRGGHRRRQSVRRQGQGDLDAVWGSLPIGHRQEPPTARPLAILGAGDQGRA